MGKLTFCATGSLATLALLSGGSLCCRAEPLPGTAPLEIKEDLRENYLEGLDRFTLQATERVVAERSARWQNRMKGGAEEVAQWLSTNRLELARMLGVRDRRAAFASPGTVGTLHHPALAGKCATHDLLRIRWPVIENGFQAEGLLLEPRNGKVAANIVHLPHAGVTPEQVLGLEPGAPEPSRQGFAFPAPDTRVVIPLTLSRAKSPRMSDYPNIYYPEGKFGKPENWKPWGRIITAREFVYRPAYVMGRHLIGYEVQSVMALVDWFQATAPDAIVRVEGWGDGGMLALYTGALDQRINHTVVSGYFGARDALWTEPADRNVFGLLRYFGDAEIATLIAPRKLRVLAIEGPQEEITRDKGDGHGAGTLMPQKPEIVASEVDKARALTQNTTSERWLELVHPGKTGAATLSEMSFTDISRPTDTPLEREERLVREMNDFSHRVLDASLITREKFLSGLDYSSPEAFDKSAEFYRDYYRERVMGCIHDPKLPLNVRTRVFEESVGYTMYEVVMDVLPDFTLYGFLVVPKPLPKGERIPLVVAQHGADGNPYTTVSREGGHNMHGVPLRGAQTYHNISPRLALEGYAVFAPQNPYVRFDRFRQIVRKANPLGWTIYSYIHCQYEQMFAWFDTLPFVDTSRIAFIGQSYGGKTAVRVPPLMQRFRAAICTGDFNEGITKMASTRYPFSFAVLGEYEMFEFDLGSTFNYSDLTMLMAPRPFLAQRGYDDGVAWDEFVGFEFARVRRRYDLLGLNERAAIHWFKGGHEIEPDNACAFLRKWLR